MFVDRADSGHNQYGFTAREGDLVDYIIPVSGDQCIGVVLKVISHSSDFDGTEWAGMNMLLENGVCAYIITSLDGGEPNVMAGLPVRVLSKIEDCA